MKTNCFATLAFDGLSFTKGRSQTWFFAKTAELGRISGLEQTSRGPPFQSSFWMMFSTSTGKVALMSLANRSLGEL